MFKEKYLIFLVSASFCKYIFANLKVQIKCFWSVSEISSRANLFIVQEINSIEIYDPTNHLIIKVLEQS